MARERKCHVRKGAAAETPDIGAASALRVNLLATTATAALITRPISAAEKARLRAQYLHFIRILARAAARADHYSTSAGITIEERLVGKRSRAKLTR